MVVGQWSSTGDKHEKETFKKWKKITSAENEEQYKDTKRKAKRAVAKITQKIKYFFCKEKVCDEKYLIDSKNKSLYYTFFLKSYKS